ncbi:MAG: AI-2E family transporter [Candidatus Dojkabacteria bacterium]|nr:MAG: AI-2E family transporter [Candidatus Dojkabacteria bacterium]
MGNQKKVFFILLILVTLVIAWFISKFVHVISLAVLTVLAFNPVYKWFLYKLKGNTNLASWLTLIVVIFALISPLILVGTLTTYQITQIVSDLNRFEFETSSLGQIVNTKVEELNQLIASYSINYKITIEDINANLYNVARSVLGFLLSKIGSVGTALPELITDTILYIVLTTYLFSTQKKLVYNIRKISPLPDDMTMMYLNRIVAMARSMINGTFTIAFVQGVVAGVVMWIAGVPYTLFFTFLAIVLAVIPLVGVGFLLFPIAFVLAITGNVFGAVLIVATFVIVISNIDNILRPKLVEQEAKLPEAITLLGIIAGISVFGFLGLIFGPILMVIAYTTYDLYLKYYAFSIKSILSKN